MTRGSIPRFDLYEELEISRLASAEVIEAAYRALVKRHHPDVSRPADAERIKRLNIAREWLVSPTRRERYDAATAAPGEGPRPTVRPAARRTRRAGGAGATGATGATAEPATPARPSSPASFGVNSREVRQFLALLRAVDVARARELVGGKATLDSAAYTEARGAALAASRTGRNDEWTFAREAASVIAKGKLAHSPLGAAVAAIVADIAGAIVVRDLLSTRDFDLLLRPWTWREERVLAPAPAGQPTDLGSVSAQVVASVRAAVRVAGREAVVRGRRYPVALGVAGAVLAGAIALAMLPQRMPDRPERGVAALTDEPAPPASLLPAAAASASAPPSAPASAPGGGPSLLPSTSPPASTSAPGSGTPLPLPPTPRAGATPRPTVFVPPTTAPTVPATSPAPTPLVSPIPTPSPPACSVVDLVGVNSSNAQLAWTGAGFTGTVLFSPSVPPQYKIGWQSLTAGASAPCTSDITVAPVAP